MKSNNEEAAASLCLKYGLRLGDGSAHACSEIGKKWFLLFVFRDLWTVFRIAGFPGFFAVSALLEPAKVLEATERQVHNLDGRV
jgi:hypothetical protein